MAKEQEARAGIYWAASARDEFYALFDTDQKLLADFIEGQRALLESSWGGEREGLTLVWSGDRIVTWDIRLKPEYRKIKRSAKPLVQQATARKTPLGAYYRIEVLRVWELKAGG